MSQTEIKIDHHRKKNRAGIEYKTVNAYQVVVVLGGVPLSSSWMSGNDSMVKITVKAMMDHLETGNITVRANRID